MPKKTAIIGLHNFSSGEVLDRLLKSKGIETKVVMDMENMRKEIDSNPNSDFYFMDINLGKPNTEHVEPALEVYNRIKHRLEKGEAQFYGISSNQSALIKAVEVGIPKKYIFDKNDYKYYETLGDIE